MFIKVAGKVTFGKEFLSFKILEDSTYKHLICLQLFSFTRHLGKSNFVIPQPLIWSKNANAVGRRVAKLYVANGVLKNFVIKITNYREYCSSNVCTKCTIKNCTELFLSINN